MYLYDLVHSYECGQAHLGMAKVSLRVNPLSAKLTKWPNTLKQLVGNLPTNCLSMFGRFVGLALKGLNLQSQFQELHLGCLTGF